MVHPMRTVRVPAQPKAYSYIRFSTPQQAKGDSHRRQADKVARYAAENGLALDSDLNLTDLGVSAYRGKNAKTGALGVFLRAVEEGTVPRGSFLLVENIDRLTREDVPDATMLFLQIINAGIVVVTLTNRERYSRERLTAEPHAIYFIISELIRANQESFRKGQLVGDAKERKRARLVAGELNGQPYTRQTPAWVRWDDASKSYSLIAERVKIIREVFKLADKGWGLDRVAKELNKRGMETWSKPKGRRAAFWHASYLRKIVVSKAPIGLFTPHKTSRHELTGARRDIPFDPIPLWPATVSEDLYWRVARRFQTTAARGKNAQRGISSVVAGVAKCDCGGSMIRISKGISRGKRYVYLLCSRANAKAKGCEHLPVRYEEVEAALRVNARVMVKHAPRGKNTEQLEKQIANLQGFADALEMDVAELADLAAREKSPAAIRRFRDKESELEGHRRVLRELRVQRDTLTTTSVRARLKALEEALVREPFDIASANGSLRQVIKKIIVQPRKANLEIHWHHSEQIDEIPFYSRHKLWNGSIIKDKGLVKT
jgi:DNA invertase Pin-like site-specific DNA recombinase